MYIKDLPHHVSNGSSAVKLFADDAKLCTCSIEQGLSVMHVSVSLLS